MKRSIKYGVSLAILLIIFFFFCAYTNNIYYKPEFKVIGDVETVCNISDSSILETYEIEKEDDKYQGMLLKEIVSLAKPISNKFSVLLTGSDGLIARLEGNDLDDCYIAFTERGWSSITFNHPVNSNIKDIREIVIVSKENDFDIGVNIINSEENIFNLTPGQMYLKTLQLYNYLDGESVKENIHKIQLYKQKKLINIQDLVSEPIKSLIVMTASGEYRFLTELGYLELFNNQINYIIPDERILYSDIAGIMVNPPVFTVMDTYKDSQYYLEHDQKVMILFIDGFGYHQYKYALENGYSNYISQLPKASLANTVYKPVTNAGFAAMVTGKTPEENGIMDRSKRNPEVKTIFDFANETKKKSILVESNTGILNLDVETIFSLDKNNDNSTDEEVFNNAIKAINEHPDLLMVHFHGLDDCGHNNGDLDIKTMETLEEIDYYVRFLSNKWDGKIILTADHGMHSRGEEGTHGYFRYEDMYIPYLIYDGGQN